MLPGWHCQLEIYMMWCQQIRLSISLGINHRQTLALPTWIRFDNLHTPLPRKFVRGSLSLSPSESHGIFYLWPKSLSIVPQSPKRGSVMDLDDQKASFDSHLIECVAGLYVPCRLRTLFRLITDRSSMGVMLRHPTGIRSGVIHYWWFAIKLVN